MGFRAFRDPGRGPGSARTTGPWAVPGVVIGGRDVVPGGKRRGPPSVPDGPTGRPTRDHEASLRANVACERGRPRTPPAGFGLPEARDPDVMTSKTQGSAGRRGWSASDTFLARSGLVGGRSLVRWQGPSVPFGMGRARDPKDPHKVGVTCTPGIGPPAPCVSSGRPQEPSPL